VWQSWRRCRVREEEVAVRSVEKCSGAEQSSTRNSRNMCRGGLSVGTAEWTAYPILCFCLWLSLWCSAPSEASTPRGWARVRRETNPLALIRSSPFGAETTTPLSRPENAVGPSIHPAYPLCFPLGQRDYESTMH
jgi:hypothetical protein